jgi:hypothetical protein
LASRCFLWHITQGRCARAARRPERLLERRGVRGGSWCSSRGARRYPRAIRHAGSSRSRPARIASPAMKTSCRSKVWIAFAASQVLARTPLRRQRASQPVRDPDLRLARGGVAARCVAPLLPSMHLSSAVSGLERVSQSRARSGPSAIRRALLLAQLGAFAGARSGCSLFVNGAVRARVSEPSVAVA